MAAGKTDFIVRRKPNFRKFLRKSPKLNFLKISAQIFTIKQWTQVILKLCKNFQYKMFIAIASMPLELRDDTLNKLLLFNYLRIQTS